MLNHNDIQAGDLLGLRGVTRHGKNRIHQHGDTWRVTMTESPTSFGHLGLESLEETFGGFEDGHKEKDHRWITFVGDPNFVITTHIRGDKPLWVE